MAEGYSWNDMRGGGGYRLPGPDHLGWWAAGALLLSVLLHVAVFLALDRVKVGLRFQEARELRTAPLDLRRMEFTPMPEEVPLPPEDLVIPPTDAASLLEEIDLLNLLPEDREFDFLPDVIDPELALELVNPALEGSSEAVALEAVAGFDVDAALPDLGRMDDYLPPAATGQVVVDPGAVRADEVDLSRFTEEILRQGADGKVAEGVLDGINSLDELIGLPENVLVTRSTLLPSDLLFEFNSADLRESARLGLMKLALLIDRNPNLVCWIEGHTDRIGSDSYNLDLSLRRARAVKAYLVEGLRIEEERIFVRGFGRSLPLVEEGDADEQAPNRRVEIRMRREAPPDEGPAAEAAARREPVSEPAPVEEPEEVLVRPRREFPPEMVEPPPRAVPVEEAPPTPLRALPVEEEAPPRAIPAEVPPPPRAERVQEPNPS